LKTGSVEHRTQRLAERNVRAAEIARGTRFLHVTNGACVTGTLEQSTVRGTYLAYPDVLIDGPVPAGLTDAEMRDVRVRFIVERGWCGEEDARREEWDRAVDNFADYDEVVLWFEHDLFDQLLLIRHLDSLSRRDVGVTKLTLICVGSFPGVEPLRGLGQLTAARLASLLDTIDCPKAKSRSRAPGATSFTVAPTGWRSPASIAGLAAFTSGRRVRFGGEMTRPEGSR